MEFFASGTPVVNRLQLANLPTLANAALIWWPTNSPGFVLQQNPALGSTNWSNAAEAVDTAGTNYQATILTTNGPRFFRLLHQ